MTGPARDPYEDRPGVLCGQASCLRFFTHGLYHWLGVDVDDAREYSTPLGPGWEIVTGPGLSLARELSEVRIEDDGAVYHLPHKRGQETLKERGPK